MGVLAADRGKSDMGVLEVRSGVALERFHAVPVECIVVDPSGAEVSIGGNQWWQVYLFADIS